MNKNIKKADKDTGNQHLSLATMHQYLDEKLPAAQMHHVEKHLLDCELCADALEGISFVEEEKDIDRSIDHLKRKIRKRSLREPVVKRRRKLVPIHWKHISVAAATLIMLVGSILVFRLNTRKTSDTSAVALTKQESVQQTPASINQEAIVQSDAQVSQPEKAKDSRLAKINPQPKPPVPAPSSTDQALLKKEENTGLSPEVAIDEIEEQLKSQQQDIVSTDNVQRNPQVVIEEAKPNSIPATTLEKRSAPLPSGGAVGITQNFITVSGKVVSAGDSSALPGVNVQIKGTTKGTVTDYRGRFSLAVPPNSSLTFNFIGMAEENVQVGSRKTIDVALKPEGEELTEVAITEETADEDEKEYTSYKPQPADGAMGYRTYLKKNLRYPEDAKNNKIEGTVRVEFVVKKEGDLTDFKVRKSLGYGCDEEAIRLIKEGPAWKPAKFNGKPVDRSVIVYVPFKL